MKKVFSSYIAEILSFSALLISSVVSFAVKNNVAGWICLAVAVVFAVIVVCVRLIKSRWKLPEQTEKSISALTVSFLMKLEHPALLVDDHGKIIWHNEALSAIDKSKSAKHGANVSGIFDGVLLPRKNSDEAPAEYMAANRHFTVQHYPVFGSAKKYDLCIMYDDTGLFESKKYIKMHNPAVMYIVVDNFSELAQGLKDNYRASSAKVSSVLTEWAATFNGLIKEFERDKYICVFDEQYVADMIESDFDIIDLVSAVTASDGGAPLTISIGVAATDGSFSEKEEIAMQALQLALQKGGAQAVVRDRTQARNYGARIRAAKKDSKGPSRNAAFTLSNLMEKCSNVIIMGHKNPDFDSIAACVGIARLAFMHGKRPFIIIGDRDADIAPALRLVSGLPEYKNVFVDDIYAQELITPSALLVIVDVNNVDMFASAEVYNNASQVVIIDHHIKKEDFTKPISLEFIDPSASSASELISEILEEKLSAGTMKKEEAVLLFSGILLDTQNFTRGTGVRTFGASFYLRSLGADPGEAKELFKNDMDEYIKLARIERNIYRYKDNIAVSFFDGIGNDVDYRLCCTVADRMLTIENVDASFVVCQVGNDVRISARSRSDELNVGTVMTYFGGGGRFDAAACKIENTETNEVLKQLENAIDDFCEGKLRRKEDESTAS
ncbi:MAG: DHH family phosphoesterase [Clostridia bacterium]|nr:DHH family phosphoesterase [Clostridia bacterium]